MNLLSTVIVVSTSCLCIPSTATTLPTIESLRLDGEVLPNVMNGHTQEDFSLISDFSNEDWLINALDGIASLVVSKLSDPTNIDEERKYLKISRAFIEPVVEYVDHTNPNGSAKKVLHILNTFLSSLEKKINGNVSQQAFAKG